MPQQRPHSLTRVGLNHFYANLGKFEPGLDNLITFIQIIGEEFIDALLAPSGGASKDDEALVE
jgi:hypothetical protein